MKSESTTKELQSKFTIRHDIAAKRHAKQHEKLKISHGKEAHKLKNKPVLMDNASKSSALSNNDSSYEKFSIPHVSRIVKS